MKHSFSCFILRLLLFVCLNLMFIFEGMFDIDYTQRQEIKKERHRRKHHRSASKKEHRKHGKCPYQRQIVSLVMSSKYPIVDSTVDEYLKNERYMCVYIYGGTIYTFVLGILLFNLHYCV